MNGQNGVWLHAVVITHFKKSEKLAMSLICMILASCRCTNAILGHSLDDLIEEAGIRSSMI